MSAFWNNLAKILIVLLVIYLVVHDRVTFRQFSHSAEKIIPKVDVEKTFEKVKHGSN